MLRNALEIVLIRNEETCFCFYFLVVVMRVWVSYFCFGFNFFFVKLGGEMKLVVYTGSFYKVLMYRFIVE